MLDFFASSDPNWSKILIVKIEMNYFRDKQNKYIWGIDTSPKCCLCSELFYEVPSRLEPEV